MQLGYANHGKKTQMKKINKGKTTVTIPKELARNIKIAAAVNSMTIAVYVGYMYNIVQSAEVKELTNG